jgi:hypothetical protein
MVVYTATIVGCYAVLACSINPSVRSERKADTARAEHGSQRPTSFHPSADHERNGDRTTKCGRITPLRLPELITLVAGLATFRCGYLSIIVKAPYKGASEILMKPW